MPQTIWSGAVSFGLVNVPVKAVSATRDKSVRFSQLHAPDGEKIRMKRTCPEHGEIPYEEVVKGYAVGKNEYVVIQPDDLEALEPEKSRTIDIEDFVDLEKVDPIYFQRPYFLVPDETGAKAYALLHTAMELTGKAAVGRFVMRNREHLVIIRPLGEGLVLETMRFYDEVVRTENVLADAPKRKEPAEREVEMAVRLVKELATEWDPEKYEDTFRERILELVEKKKKGETVRVTPPKAETGVEQDLAAALEESLREIAR
jgi:DNA end-binding protein Ku